MKMNVKIVVIILFLTTCKTIQAQIEKTTLDSLYIKQVEEIDIPHKVLHAEPLFIDLIRDLGARKGEREWNLGLGLSDNLNYDTYEALIEYEWAPINRLGFEVELPFYFHSSNKDSEKSETPKSQLNSLKLATQWTFYVNDIKAISMALGYINEFQLPEFQNFNSSIFKGNVYNPFMVIAKRWGNNFHTLLYTGPRFDQNFDTKNFQTDYDMNTSFHYMISGTKNFVGVEFNKTFTHQNFDLTIRPQMRVEITNNLLIGIVAGIPVSKQNARLSSFLRLIWEPKSH